MKDFSYVKFFFPHTTKFAEFIVPGNLAEDLNAEFDWDNGSAIDHKRPNYTPDDFMFDNCKIPEFKIEFFTGTYGCSDACGASTNRDAEILASVRRWGTDDLQAIVRNGVRIMESGSASIDNPYYIDASEDKEEM